MQPTHRGTAASLFFHWDSVLRPASVCPCVFACGYVGVWAWVSGGVCVRPWVCPLPLDKTEWCETEKKTDAPTRTPKHMERTTRDRESGRIHTETGEGVENESAWWVCSKREGRGGETTSQLPHKTHLCVVWSPSSSIPRSIFSTLFRSDRSTPRNGLHTLFLPNGIFSSLPAKWNFVHPCFGALNPSFFLCFLRPQRYKSSCRT